MYPAKLAYLLAIILFVGCATPPPAEPQKPIDSAKDNPPEPMKPVTPPTVVEPKRSEQEIRETREKKVRRLLEVTNAGALAMQIMNEMLDAFQGMPNLPEGFIEKFKELAHPQDLTELAVPVYMKHLEDKSLDEKDLDAAIAFYESPQGAHFMQAIPSITMECQQAGAQWGQELAIKALQSLQEDALDQDPESEEEVPLEEEEEDHNETPEDEQD